MKIQNKSNDKKYFTIIPNYIANHSSANDQALYFQMKKIVGDNEGICYASEKYFKDKLKIGSKSLKKSINYLKENGWIEEAGTRKVKTDGGKQDVRVYLVKDIWKMNTDYYHNKGVSEREPLTDKGVFKSNPRGVQKETKGVASEQQRRTTNKNKKKNIDFDLFYSKFPIKKNREQVKKTWFKLDKEKILPKIDVLLKALELQIAEKKQLKQDGKFSATWKYPASWLNAHSWEDEITKIKNWR